MDEHKRRTARSFHILMSVILLLAGVLVRAGGELNDFTIFFSRSFPGSIPAYFEVVVESSGKTLYREHPDEEPLEFQISQEHVAKLFEHAKNLDFFQTPVASKRKVAFTGDKTLRFESADGRRFETNFNHTENEDARALLQWFHKVAETERHLLELERTTQFDRLGVNKTLLQFQISFEKHRVIAPKQFLPILNRIAKDKKIVHIARSRAASLAERIEREGADNRQ